MWQEETILAQAPIILGMYNRAYYLGYQGNLVYTRRDTHHMYKLGVPNSLLPHVHGHHPSYYSQLPSHHSLSAIPSTIFQTREESNKDQTETAQGEASLCSLNCAAAPGPARITTMLSEIYNFMTLHELRRCTRPCQDNDHALLQTPRLYCHQATPLHPALPG